MNRRKFLETAGVIGGMSMMSAFPERLSGTAVEEQPNILFIMTDDQAQWAMGAYGNSEIHTPNMDRLAAEGMKFTNAFTCPVCSPSRAMIMTGMYNHQVGIDDWISPRETVGIPGHIPTLAQELQRAGYKTGLIGKWHLGHTTPDLYPTNRGFDYFMGMLEGGYEGAMMNPKLLVNGRQHQYKGGLTDVLANDAIRFMNTYREQPFALFFHTRRPHGPYVPVPDEDWEPYRGKTLSIPDVAEEHRERVRTTMEKYYASVTSVDRNLGRLMDALEESGQLEKTIIIFIGDNGYNIGHHNIISKGNGASLDTRVTRPNMWDTSAKVPLLIRYPGVTRPGSVCHELVNSIDFFPTLLEAVGAKRRPGLALEGLNMMPLLRGEQTVWRDELYLVYNLHNSNTRNGRMRMIRTHDWKLVHHYEETMGHELFDLTKDPDEKTNLYGKPAVRNIQEMLDKRLILFEKRTGAYK